MRVKVADMDPYTNTANDMLTIKANGIVFCGFLASPPKKVFITVIYCMKVVKNTLVLQTSVQYIDYG